MYTDINLQICSTECPKGMNKSNCLVRQYMTGKPELFNESMNENLFKLAQEYNSARGKYEGALSDIFQLCKQCKDKVR